MSIRETQADRSRKIHCMDGNFRNELLKQTLVACLCLFALIGQAIADTSSEGEHARAIHHSSATHPILFEIIEDGVRTNQFVSVSIWASKVHRVQTAECLITMFFKIGNDKHVGLGMYSASTNEATIRNLSISPNAVSFDMIPFAFDRPLRFVATRESGQTGLYQANVVGLWTGWLDKTKLIKTEWRQVQSITLPSSTIDY